MRALPPMSIADGDPSSDLIHALRNALGSTGLSLAVARQALASGDTQALLSFLIEAQTACEQSCTLLAGLSHQPTIRACPPLGGAAR